MSSQPPTHQFASAANAQSQRPIPAEAHELIIRQQPEHGKVFIGKEKDRKPIDPPPVVQLLISDTLDPYRRYLHSPYYFMSTSLVDDEDTQPNVDKEELACALGGTLVSSLHRIKDINGESSAFFVFGDLSVKLEGLFKLKFTLFELRGKEVEHVRDVISAPFQVYSAKTWPGMGESTGMTRMLSDQGIRLRLRKEPRFRLQPQGPASDDYSPRQYTPRRSKSIVESEMRRRESEVSAAASTQTAPTPYHHRDSNGSRDMPIDQSIDQRIDRAIEPVIEPAEEEYANNGAVPSPVCPQPKPPMASMTSLLNESRKRELSMSLNRGSPATIMASNEPFPKRTRPDEEPAQPAMYSPYAVQQNMNPPAQNYQAPFQMYPAGQFQAINAQAQQQPQLGRPPSYSHGPPNFINQRPGFDFTSGREAVSMSPFNSPSSSLGLPDSQFQQRASGNLSIHGVKPTHQSMLNQVFTAPPSYPGSQQEMMFQQQQFQNQQEEQQQQQGMQQSLPNRPLSNMSGFHYQQDPDHAIDPMLAAQPHPQGHSQGMRRLPSMISPHMASNMNPNMGVNSAGAGHLTPQPPQYFNRGISSPNPHMMQQPQQHEMGSPFFMNQGLGVGQGMRGMQPGQDGLGFRAQEGVGFRETFVGTPTQSESEMGDMTPQGHGHGHP